MADDPVLRLKLEGLTKRFPGVLANDQVGFSVKPGEIHALLGENGAGKSTLVKMIYGIMQPDAGTMWWDGVETTFSNPRAARRAGIGMVFQHFSLFEAMTVLENIALGMDAAIRPNALEAKVREVMDSYGLKLDPQRIVSTLSVGERQRIEIVRALLLNPKLLIMDEPTSVLTPQEVAQLFATLRQLASEGCSILYISHKLHEIKELCDVATILRGGKVVGTCDPKAETSRSMAEMMIGGDLKDVTKAASRQTGPARLVVQDLNVPKGGHFGVALHDVSFAVGEGEILGIAGVAGNGQNELLNVLCGEVLSVDANALQLGGAAIGQMGPTERRKAGLCAVPEERNGHAAVPDFSLSDNTILTARDRKHLVNVGMVNAGAARDYAAHIIEAFGVKATGPGAMAESLSGGNLQKYIMGREILQAPDVLVVSQPTWGVDAGAAAAIHQALVDLAAAGSAIVVISQDLDELLALSDTLCVINEGRLSRPMPVSGVSIEEIGLLMGGVHGDPEATVEMTEALHAVPA
ncbi:ABC transporter ATP-binding protein [Mariluticola halotolerans]|uniref:ABC transporter ATP-binding protein n=1 Tax=Mariluticola halotolerans TaxID=2909283 RepID=UPI0026E1D0D3|nr:ABC transporter ATP-binding protein [Mariluticola halotolerans]UJQ94387.1 ABC transporter ATP-binding protein [Mariluticola halotolerans]